MITSIILKSLKTRLISQSKVVIILKILFIAPFVFLFFSTNFLIFFPDVYKLIEKPKHYQHLQIVNDTKITHSFILLKKQYLKSNWKFLYNLNTHINYSNIIQIETNEKVNLFFKVDTNEFNRVAVCRITKSSNFPSHSLILEVPSPKFILFASEFNSNHINKIIRKDNYEDWLYFLYNFTLFVLIIYALIHLPSDSKFKFIYILLLIILIGGVGLILYNDIFYLLKIYKLI